MQLKSALRWLWASPMHVALLDCAHTRSIPHTRSIIVGKSCAYWLSQCIVQCPCVLWALAFMATYLGFLVAVPARTMQDRQARLFTDSWCGKHTPWIRLVMQETCHAWPNYVIFMVALECNKLCNTGMDWVCAWDVCSSFNMINGCMWVWYVLLLATRFYYHTY